MRRLFISDSKRSRLKIGFRLLAVTIGILQHWVNRHAMNPDGVSYLDVADAYLRGDWKMAVNAMWSPLYSWFLAVALALFKPSPYWEFPVVQLVNFIIYLCALICFEFFLREVLRFRRAQTAEGAGNGWATFPEWALIALGYVLFIWSSVYLMKMNLGRVHPDTCVAAVVYLASGISLRIRRGATDWPTFIALGIVLGIGYLAKAPMFPLAFIFLAVSLFLVGNLRRAAPRASIAFALFLSLSVPFIVALSTAKGRLTFSDSGRVNYVWKVNEMGVYWQGEPPGSGAPAHPVRKLFDAPAIYEYGTPISSTYPLHYDPSYWMEGASPHFELKPQIHVLLSSMRTCYVTLFDIHGSLIVGLFILFYMGRRGWLTVRDISEYWFLLTPALAALVMYSLVHVEQRYIAPFVVLLYMALFSGVRLPDSQESKRLLKAIMMTILVMFFIYISPSTTHAAYLTAQDLFKGEASRRNVPWQVADGLKRIGVQPGDKVALIIAGDPYDSSMWARLDRLRIIAEVPTGDADDFWTASSSVKNQVLQTFARAGAKLVVTDKSPTLATADGWQKIDDTDYHAYFLSK